MPTLNYYTASWSKEDLQREIEWSKRFTETLEQLYDEAEITEDVKRKIDLFTTVISDAITRLHELEAVVESLLKDDKIK